MRKVLIMLVGLLTCLGSLAVSRKQTVGDDGIVTLEYEFDDFASISTQTEGGDYRFAIQGFTEVDELGKPAVLRRLETFEIPDDVPGVRLEVIEECDTVNVVCAPARMPKVDKLGAESLDYAEPISPYSGIWPESVTELLEPGIYRGLTVGYLRIAPIRYDYQSQQVLVTRRLKIKFHYDAGSGQSMQAMRKTKPVSHNVSRESYANVFSVNLQEDENQEKITPYGFTLPGGTGHRIRQKLLRDY